MTGEAVFSEGDGGRRQIRQFGCVLGLILGGWGGYLLWQGRAAWAPVLAAAVLSVAAFWRQWPGTRLVFSGWMGVARVMSRFSTGLLLTLIYFAVLTPLALLARLCGVRFLDRGFRGPEQSYWRTPRDKDAAGGEKQS